MSENKRHDDFFLLFFCFNGSSGRQNIGQGCSRWKIKIIMFLKETSLGVAQTISEP